MKTLVWDFDGTLGHYHGGLWSGIVREILLEETGQSPPVETIRVHLQDGFPWNRPMEPHPHLNDPEVWWSAARGPIAKAICAGGVEPGRAAQLAPRLREKYLDPSRWRLFDDALPTLAALSVAGWTHVLLSNHVPELPAIAASLGVSSHMAMMFNSAATGYEKPHPQAYANVRAALPQCETFWMIGDNCDADVLGAEAAGFSAILVRRPDPRARRYCEALAQVRGILET